MATHVVQHKTRELTMSRPDQSLNGDKNRTTSSSEVISVPVSMVRSAMAYLKRNVERARLTRLSLPAAWAKLGRHVYQSGVLRSIYQEQFEKIDLLYKQMEALGSHNLEHQQQAGLAEKTKSFVVSTTEWFEKKRIRRKLTRIETQLGRLAYFEQRKKAGPKKQVLSIVQMRRRQKMIEHEIERLSEPLDGRWLAPKPFLLGSGAVVLLCSAGTMAAMCSQFSDGSGELLDPVPPSGGSNVVAVEEDKTDSPVGFGVALDPVSPDGRGTVVAVQEHESDSPVGGFGVVSDSVTPRDESASPLKVEKPDLFKLGRIAEGLVPVSDPKSKPSAVTKTTGTSNYVTYRYSNYWTYQIASTGRNWQKARAAKKNFEAELKRVRTEYWKAYPDGAGIVKLRQQYERLLFEKDLSFFLVDLIEGPDGPLSAMTKLTGVQADSGIAPIARGAFKRWVIAVREQLGATFHGGRGANRRFRRGQLINPSPSQLLEAIKATADLAERYALLRDWSEYQTAGHEQDFYPTPQAYLTYIYRIDGEPRNQKQAVTWYRQLAKTVGEEALLEAADKQRRKPKTSMGIVQGSNRKPLYDLLEQFDHKSN